MAPLEYSGVGAAIIAVFICIFLFYFQLKKGSGSHDKKLAPGPSGWPFVGCLPLLGKLVHRDFYDLSKKHGPLMFMRLGSIPTIVISSAEMAKEVMKTQDLVFCSRPDLVVTTIITSGQKDLAWAPHGPHWQFMRKLCTTELFTTKRIGQFEGARKVEIMDMLTAVLEESKQSKTVPIKYHIQNMTTNHLTYMVGRKRFFGAKAVDTKLTTEFREVFKGLMSIAGVIEFGDYLPFLKRFDLQGNKKRAKTLLQKFYAFVDMLSDESQKELRSEEEHVSLVDILFSLDPESFKVDDADVTDARTVATSLFGDLIVAGTDTSSTHVEWMMVELLCNPDIMKKAQDELDVVVGRDRLVEESDIPNLPYLQAIVKETFRLHPVLPLLIPRENKEASTIAGYYIPLKSRLFVNVWAIGRDPTRWDSPLKFDPHRFLTSDIDIRGADFDLIPFGAGRRLCPGMNLGLSMVNLASAALLQAFNWELPPGVKPEDVDMKEEAGLTLVKAVPLVVCAKPRLPTNLLIIAEH